MAYRGNPIPAMTNTHPPLERPVVMIGQQYLSQYPVELIFPSQNLSSTGDIKDVNDTIIFKIKRKNIFSSRRFLTDDVGNILVTLRNKKMSLHDRWVGYRGESKEEKDLLFSVKRSSMFGKNIKLDVFLANNESEQVPDFKIIGRGWIERSCVIFWGDDGDSKSIIAQTHRGHNYLPTALSLVDSGNFALTTYPNVDYAFTTALAILLNEMNRTLEALGKTNKAMGLAQNIISLATN